MGLAAAAVPRVHPNPDNMKGKVYFANSYMEAWALALCIFAAVLLVTLLAIT